MGITIQKQCIERLFRKAETFSLKCQTQIFWELYNQSKINTMYIWNQITITIGSMKHYGSVERNIKV